MFRQEGIQGFFRGVWIPLWSITAVRATSFSIYTKSKAYLQSTNVFNSDKLSKVALSSTFAGFSSGFVISVASAPFELVKIKRQLEFQIALNRGLPYSDKGTIGSSKEIIRNQGYRGIYRGLPLHTFRDTLGTGLYFCIYDSIKHITFTNPNSKLSQYSYLMPIQLSSFLGGAFAGIGSWFLVYPIDIVKIVVQQRMLSNMDRKSAKDIFIHLVRGSDPNQKPRPILVGLSKLYRGVWVSCLRSMTTHGLMWTIYETLMKNI